MASVVTFNFNTTLHNRSGKYNIILCKTDIGIFIDWIDNYLHLILILQSSSQLDDEVKGLPNHIHQVDFLSTPSSYGEPMYCSSHLVLEMRQML